MVFISMLDLKLVRNFRIDSKNFYVIFLNLNFRCCEYKSLHLTIRVFGDVWPGDERRSYFPSDKTTGDLERFD